MPKKRIKDLGNRKNFITCTAIEANLDIIF